MIGMYGDAWNEREHLPALFVDSHGPGRRVAGAREVLEQLMDRSCPRSCGAANGVTDPNDRGVEEPAGERLLGFDHPAILPRVTVNTQINCRGHSDHEPYDANSSTITV